MFNDDSSLFYFLPTQDRCIEHQYFYAQIPANPKDKMQLLSVIAEQLSFPDYFGFNWDAMEECLRDLSWIEEKDVVIAHAGVPSSLAAQEIRIYLHILRSCVKYWETHERHRLSVTFPDESRIQLSQYL